MGVSKVNFDKYLLDFFSLESLKRSGLANSENEIDFEALKNYTQLHQFTTIHGVSDQDTNDKYPE